MILSGTKTRKGLTDLKFLKNGENFYLGFNVNQVSKNRLNELGFNLPLSDGDTILPSPNIGKHSHFNSEGKINIRKDLPKETWYKEIYWEWYQYQGRQKILKSDIKFRPYKRYPREEIEGNRFELKVVGSAIVIDKKFAFDSGDKSILGAINLISEVAGEVQIFNEKIEDYDRVKRVRLNWDILPSGEFPFQIIDKVIEQRYESRKEQIPIKQRQKFFEALEPDLIATGRGGFSGYIIYFFEKQKIAFLESIYYGNAIYVFGQDWEKLSQLTKKEILDESLQTARIIHKKKYYNEVRKILKGKQ